MSKENSLFKDATIKRLISNVKITVKHKKAVNKWFTNCMVCPKMKYRLLRRA